MARSRRRRGASFAAGTVALVATGLACHPTESVSFTLDVPTAVTPSAAWYEIGAFANGSCNALLPQLQGGLPTSGESSRVVFAPSTSPEPSIGDLPRGTYAFAVTAKDASCNVLATGCSAANVDSTSSVSVELTALGSPSPTCSDSTSCVDGACVPPGEGSNDVGAGCSLTLVGSGPLAEALDTGGGEITSAPGVVVTPDGFLLAYREFDPTMSAARLTLFPVDPNGSAGTVSQTTLPMRCRVVESDATGLAWNGDHGLAVVSHELCPDIGFSGEDTVRVDATGATLTSGFASIQTPDQQTLTLTTGHAVAAEPGGTEFFVTQVITNKSPTTMPPYATVSLTDGLNASLAAQYASPSTVTSTVVASTSTLVAAGSVGVDANASTQTENAQTPQALGPLDEAGAGDAGDDAGHTGGTGGPVPDGGDDDGTGTGGDDGGGAGISGQSAYLHVGAPASDLSSLPLLGSWPADWLSLAADANRTYAVSGLSGAATLRFADVGGMLSGVTPVQLTGEGQVIFADAALAGDHLFLAVERSGALALVTYENATTTPKLLRQIDLDKDPRVGTFTDLADGRVAIAASSSRIAIVWTTQKTLLERDPVGGYAIYACSK